MQDSTRTSGTVSQAKRATLANIYCYILACSQEKAAGKDGGEDHARKETSGTHVNRSTPKRS